MPDRSLLFSPHPLPVRILPFLAAALALAWAVPGLPGPAPAAADAQLEMRESSWSASAPGNTLETVVRTYVKGRMRRVESELAPGAPDSLARAWASVQIDRLDRDSSYFHRPSQAAYLPLALAATREANTRAAARFGEARRNGTAPPDTLSPVEVTELAGRRTILGVACRGVLLKLEFAFHDSVLARGRPLTGVLADTVWLAPVSAAAGELAGFERAFAQATASEQYLAAATPTQLAQARGQGLVAVVERAVRRLEGFPLEMHFVNLLRGLPPEVSGVPRLPDGSVLVQRTRRRAVALERATLSAGLFELPKGVRRIERAPAGQTP